VQLAEPELEEYVPIEQYEQLEDELAPGNSENDPAAQRAHDIDPALDT
jgi:hypothetical protein